jgi:hypothetical protein
MKYTRTEAGEVIEVKGCTSCPHKSDHCEHGIVAFMVCRAPTLRADNNFRPTKKKLIGQWTGAYHASCPLPSEPKNVPELEAKK